MEHGGYVDTELYGAQTKGVNRRVIADQGAARPDSPARSIQVFWCSAFPDRPSGVQGGVPTGTAYSDLSS